MNEKHYEDVTAESHALYTSPFYFCTYEESYIKELW